MERDKRNTMNQNPNTNIKKENMGKGGAEKKIGNQHLGSEKQTAGGQQHQGSQKQTVGGQQKQGK